MVCCKFVFPWLLATSNIFSYVICLEAIITIWFRARYNNNVWLLEPYDLCMNPESLVWTWACHHLVAHWQNGNNQTHLVGLFWVNMWTSRRAVSSLLQDDVVIVVSSTPPNMISEIQKIQLHKMSGYIMALNSLIWKDWDGKILEIRRPSLLIPISLIHPHSSLPIQKITLAQGPRRGWGANYQVCTILFFF